MTPAMPLLPARIERPTACLTLLRIVYIWIQFGDTLRAWPAQVRRIKWHQGRYWVLVHTRYGSYQRVAKYVPAEEIMLKLPVRCDEDWPWRWPTSLKVNKVVQPIHPILKIAV